MQAHGSVHVDQLSENDGEPSVSLSTIAENFLYGKASVSVRFASLANLENDSGWCVTVAARPNCGAPNRLIVSRRTLTRMQLTPGAKVTIGMRAIRTPGGLFSYERQPAGRVRLALPDQGRIESLRQLLSLNGRGAARCLCGPGEQIPFPEKRVAELALLLPQRGPAEKLTGLGSGYTPSGDDILCGYLAALAVFTGRVPEHLGDLDMYACGRTTPLSATSLRFAIRGHIASDLAAVLAELAIKDGTSCKKGAEYIESVGHSSGSDTLFGVYLALTTMLREGEAT